MPRDGNRAGGQKAVRIASIPAQRAVGWPAKRFRLKSLDELFISIDQAVETRETLLRAGERAALEKAIATAVIPELKNRITDTRRLVEPGEAAAAAEPETPPVDIGAWLAMLTDPGARAYHHMMDEFERSGCSAAWFLEGPVREMAARLGELWDTENIGFFEVTLAVSRLQAFVWEMVQQRLLDARPVHPGKRILLARMAGEEHTLGLLVVAACFQERNWQVFGGVDLEAGPAVLETLAREDFAALGLSASSPCRLDALRRFLKRVRKASLNRDLFVFAGGSDAVARAEDYRKAGVDVVANDARTALRIADRISPD